MKEVNKDGKNMQIVSYVVKILFLVFCINLTGCYHYLYTESTVSMHDVIKDPHVIQTESYKNINNNVTTVAIIAPDSCRKQSAMSASTQQQDFIRSSCGVEIGIIERSLLGAGYNVISWEMLESMSKEGSFFQSGKELGIDILFSINSLENITADSSTLDLERSYYRSDRSGNKGAPWALGESHKIQIRRQLKDYEGAITGLSLGAAIDVTAIEVKTGKSIWYYQAAFYDVKKRDNKFTAAFSGRKNRWRIFQINGEIVKYQRSNSESRSIERENKRSNLRDDVFIKYLKIAVSSFITSFKTGS